jgi:tRNA (guanine37-N1)-methyltransferase
LGRAVESGQVELALLDLRDFTEDKHRSTDDRPYGGGPGMVLKIEPIYRALKQLQAGPEFRSGAGETEQTILLSAKGALFTQQVAEQWSQQLDHLVLICGHYEGVDERVAQHLVDAEMRIGDYVLTGGEPAALVMVDAVTRLLPEVLGNPDSPSDESHSQPGVMGHPVYTRPENFHGWQVPEVLLTGHHAQIEQWRQDQRHSVAETDQRSAPTPQDET